MAQNRGKKFEKQFERDWGKSFPGSFLLRLKDDTSGYFHSSRNPSDFIAYVDGQLFLLECKCHLGNTFNFANLPQYDDLLSYRGMKGVNLGVVLWFEEHDKVLYFPLATITQMILDGQKSINVRKLEGYDYIDLPSEKKRVFLSTDYRSIIDYVKKGDSK